MTAADIPFPDTPDVERIRAAVIRAALEGYEQAAMSGLCGEGAWEAAVSAMRRLDLRTALAGSPAPPGQHATDGDVDSRSAAGPGVPTATDE